MGFFSFGTPRASNIKTLDTVDFKTAINDKNVQLIDVRTPAEYQAGTILHANNIDVYSPDFENIVDKLLDKSRPVAVFCHSGQRSKAAAQFLEKKGFPTIYNLKFGIISWQ